MKHAAASFREACLVGQSIRESPEWSRTARGAFKAKAEVAGDRSHSVLSRDQIANRRRRTTVRDVHNVG